MNIYADRTRKNKNQPVSNDLSRKKNCNGSIFQLVDNRPEAVTQRNLQVMANNSPRTMQLTTFKGVTDNSVSPRTTILQFKTTDGTAMAGLVTPNRAQSVRIQELLSSINNVGSLMRGSRTLYRNEDVRLDMQGMTTTGYYNLQIQIGRGTVATVLIHPDVANDQLTEVIQAFLDSQATGITKIVDPDDKKEVEQTKGYYDDYERLGKFDRDMIDRSRKQGIYPPRQD